MEMDDNARQV